MKLVNVLESGCDSGKLRWSMAARREEQSFSLTKIIAVSLSQPSRFSQGRRSLVSLISLLIAKSLTVKRWVERCLGLNKFH